MSTEISYDPAGCVNGKSAVGLITGGSNQAEVMQPFIPAACSGEGPSNQFSLAPQNVQLWGAVWGARQRVVLLPGHSTQKPEIDMFGKTALIVPLPPLGRALSGPKPNDSRMITPGSGGVVGRGLGRGGGGGVVTPPPPPPVPPAPPLAKACVWKRVVAHRTAIKKLTRIALLSGSRGLVGPFLGGNGLMNPPNVGGRTFFSVVLRGVYFFAASSGGGCPLSWISSTSSSARS